MWPPTSRIPTKSYGGRRKRTLSGNNTDQDDETPKPVWEAVHLTDLVALNFAKASVSNVSVVNIFHTLHSSYRIFLQQIESACATDTLGQIATYELGTWTYLYEKQSTAQHTDSPPEDPVVTLDDVLLEYLPPTHPHLPLLLGYTTALIIDSVEVIRPLLPSLILLTRAVSRRATLDLTHCLFSVADSNWEDFSLCMTISRQIGREDEYLMWLSRHLTWPFIHQGGMGHLLRLGRDYPSLAAVVLSIVQLCVPKKRTPIRPDWEPLVTELILLVCTYSIQSTSTNQLIQLASAFPSQHTPLPSLSLLLHLAIKSNRPDYPNTALYPLVKRNLTFTLLRQVLPPSTLKSQITELFADRTLAPLAMAISRDWKDHIDYDDESDNFESTPEFLERVEREYLTATEGVIWRFEDVLEEWIGEWPDGRQLGSSKIPRTRRIVFTEEEEFGGSLVKKLVPRSGLVMDTPLPSKVFDPKTERRAVLEKLFKLSSIGRTESPAKTNGTEMDDDAGGSFLQRLGLTHVPSGSTDDLDTGAYDARQRRKNGKRRIVLSDVDEAVVYKDGSPEAHCTRKVNQRCRKRRRFRQHDVTLEGSSYEDSCTEGVDLENQSVHDDSDMELPTSDIDELSITIDPNRAALQGVSLNKTVRRGSRRSLVGTPSKMLVRESSPVFLDETSEDELAI